MIRPIRVHLLPALFEPAELAGGTAVVIDVLRATTTILYALAAGARRVIPCGDIDEAREIASRLSEGTALLGGERGGRRIPGFDLGNSPAEYDRATVPGKTIVFTTTNGTAALLRAGEAHRVVAGGFANLNALVHWLSRQSGPVHFVCAGTDGSVTLEDVLCAGTLVRGLCRAVPEIELVDDAAALAVNLSETEAGHYDSFLSALRNSRGGRNLVELGMDADIVTAAEWDRTPVIAELSRHPWQIEPVRDFEPTSVRFVEPPRGR